MWVEHGAGGWKGVKGRREGKGGLVGIEGDSYPDPAASSVEGWLPAPLSRSVCSPSFRLSDVSILDIGYTRLLFVAANGHWHRRIPAYDLLLCFRRMLRRPSNVSSLFLSPIFSFPLSFNPHLAHRSCMLYRSHRSSVISILIFFAESISIFPRF